MGIRIGSIKVGDQGEYIGRAGKGKAGSPLANPFRIGKDGDREQVIAKYRTWLWGCMRHGNAEVMYELDRLRRLANELDGVTLVCFCRSVDEDRPACHGDIIASAIRWLEDQIQADPRLGALMELGAALHQIG